MLTTTTKTAPRLAGHTLVEAATVTKFRRAGMLARSLKLQRTALQLARDFIQQRRPGLARAFLDIWEAERRAYKLALAWQQL